MDRVKLRGLVTKKVKEKEEVKKESVKKGPKRSYFKRKAGEQNKEKNPSKRQKTQEDDIEADTGKDMKNSDHQKSDVYPTFGETKDHLKVTFAN